MYHISRRLLSVAIPLLLAAFAVNAKKNYVNNSAYAEPIEGRWDMTIDMDGKKFPSWLEVSHSGSSMLVGHYVGMGGSARPVSRVYFADGKMKFTVPRQWEPVDKDIEFEATLSNDVLTGTMVYTDGKTYNWTAMRASALKRDKAPVWGAPVKLFNGKDLKGWHAADGKDNQWLAENGILRSPKTGANLVTDQKFTDFKLHIEFRVPQHSNSGVYLRGRYEVQVADSYGMEPSKDQLGAVYGFIKPLEMAAKSPGEWQTFDITLVGRIVSVVANGKKIIYDQEIPGITGGALDSNEGEPGPLYIQGDHGPVEYRNITITPIK